MFTENLNLNNDKLKAFYNYPIQKHSIPNNKASVWVVVDLMFWFIKVRVNKKVKIKLDQSI